MAARRRKDRVRIDGVPGLALGEEALYALRHGPLMMHVSYLIGTMPFMLALLFFWFDMSRNAQATLSVIPAAVGLTGLFVWMKVWHVVHATQMRDYISGRPSRTWTVSRVWGIFHRQSFAHALGLLLMPLALLLALPFPLCHAFFYSLSAVDGDEEGSEGLWLRAWRQARLWKGQNLKVVWLFSPWLLGAILSFAMGMGYLLRGDAGFLDAMTGTDVMTWIGFAFWVVCLIPVSPLGILIGVNIGLGLVMLPSLLTSFFGVQTVLGMSGPWGVLNSGYLITVFCVCYLIMDPIMRTIYVLRAYYGDSLVSGEAVRSDLLMYRRRAQGAAMAVLVGILLLSGSTASLQAAVTDEVSAEVQELDRAIEQTLQQRKFQWREAGDPVFEEPEEVADATTDVDSGELSVVDRIRLWVTDVRERFEAWLNKKTPTTARTGGPMNMSWLSGLSFGGWSLIVILCVVVMGALFFVIQRNRRSRVLSTLQAAVVVAAEVLPDVSDENVMADALPSDEWMKMGDDFLAKGEIRLALRAYTLATLSALAYVRVIRLARHKSNRDYSVEVRRGLRDTPAVMDAFMQNMRQLEESWYGDHVVDPTSMSEFSVNQKRILSYVRAQATS